MNVYAWHDRTLAQHLALWNQYDAEGYRFISLSVYGAPASAYYAAVVTPSPNPQHHHASVPLSDLQETLDAEAAQGYGPVIIAATGPSDSPLYAVVCEPQDTNPWTVNGIGLPVIAWQLQTLNNGRSTTGPPAASDLFVSVYNDQQHFAYLTAQGTIMDAWYGTGGWNLQQINSGTDGGPGTPRTDAPAAVDSLFVSVYNDQQHFTYRDAGDNIQDAWYGSDGWHTQQINNGALSALGKTPGPPALGGLFVSVYNNQQHFVYLAEGGTLVDAWYGTGGWNLQQINNGGNLLGGVTDGPPAVGGLFVSVYNDQQHFAYLTDGGTIVDAWYGTGGWSLQQINRGTDKGTGTPPQTNGPAAAGELFISVYNDQQHFTYLAGGGTVLDAWYGTDGWALQQLNSGPAGGPGTPERTKGPAAVGGELAVSVYNNQQHFTYLTNGGTIVDIWYDTDGWNVQTLNNQPVNYTATTIGPPAVQGPVASVYNAQLHLAYLDQNGNVQDVWYGTSVPSMAEANARAKFQGLILRWAAAYGDAAGPAYVAIWAPNTALTMWNNDGVADTIGGYDARYVAEISGWCRPALVTLNASAEYLSLFVDNQIGQWLAYPQLTSAQYQATFDTLKPQGFYPICVQAAGTEAPSATFSTIFAQSQDVVPKPFLPNGPTGNSEIDQVIEQLMVTYRTRHAALAIVHGTQLVYARGYTMAEPNWPTVEPVTCFRLASVSKVVAALAIYQLIEEAKLALSDTVQGILALTTPIGGPPVDSRFHEITVQQLLEHTSGLASGGYDDGLTVQSAFPGSSLPVSNAMTDSFVATMTLQSDPGAKQLYSNCGYYLLGRIVAKLRGYPRTIDAYMASLFAPLSITRIRRAASLLSDQPPDEARYQDPDLIVTPSQMTNAQPLVPDLYGNLQLEILEGPTGLSAAATDLGRLIAILISQQDNPAMTRQTLVNMLTAGAEFKAAHPGWNSGYGFDGIVNNGGGLFYAQKGGSMDSTATVLQLNGTWGFTMLWANGYPSTVPNSIWYPDFQPVMTIAETALRDSPDLFPRFGMPSL